MENNQDKLNQFKDLRQISLSDTEKRDLRERLVEYMKLKPLPEKRAKAFLLYRTTRDSSSVFGWNWLSITAVGYRAIAALLAVIVGGGMVLASEGSLPGEALYTVKVNVSEPVRTALATTPESKARVQERLLERRLQEASKLASSGRLDEKTKNDIHSRITEHVRKEQQQLARVETVLEEKEPEFIALKTRGIVQAYEEVLDILSTKVEEDRLALERMNHDQGDNEEISISMLAAPEVEFEQRTSDEDPSRERLDDGVAEARREGNGFSQEQIRELPTDEDDFSIAQVLDLPIGGFDDDYSTTTIATTTTQTSSTEVGSEDSASRLKKEDLSPGLREQVEERAGSATRRLDEARRAFQERHGDFSERSIAAFEEKFATAEERLKVADRLFEIGQAQEAISTYTSVVVLSEEIKALVRIRTIIDLSATSNNSSDRTQMTNRRIDSQSAAREVSEKSRDARGLINQIRNTLR